MWLTQLEMAELFDATKQNISLPLKNVFEDGELDVSSVVKDSLTTAADGKHYQTLLYNLDAILAVGYRVRSKRGVQFRRWASTILKEYLTKGFVMDDDRLKNPNGRPDYFDEMLARIRDIRTSEKHFYQKVRDLFALSSDYDKTDKATQVFFATVQNLLIFAVTQKTASELRAKGKQETRIAFWKSSVDQIITTNGFPLLSHAGAVSHKQMEARTKHKVIEADQ